MRWCYRCGSTSAWHQRDFFNKPFVKKGMFPHKHYFQTEALHKKKVSHDLYWNEERRVYSNLHFFILLCKVINIQCHCQHNLFMTLSIHVLSFFISIIVPLFCCYKLFCTQYFFPGKEVREENVLDWMSSDILAYIF